MKQDVIALTANVKKAMQCVDYLMKRPKTEMVGLGLIYGVPGVGKTRFARRFSIQNDFIYLRLESTTTARSFAIQLYEALKVKFNVSEPTRGSANAIFEKCVDLINDVEREVIIFVDEIDYAFRDHKLLGAVRDIVDETLAIIILVGMQDAKRRLLQANSHYFDRCNYFVEFKTLKLKDVKLVCDTVSDVQMDADVIKTIWSISKGTLRKIVKLIYAIESIAKSRKMTSISITDVKGVLGDTANSTNLS